MKYFFFFVKLQSISYFKTLLTTDLINKVGLNTTKPEENKTDNKIQYETKSMSQLIDEDSAVIKERINNTNVSWL